jgi:hypothetical protein
MSAIKNRPNHSLTHHPLPPTTTMKRLLAALLLSLNVRRAASYIQHSFTFPNIPFTAGAYHIHSPTHFMQPHGFSLPGFKIVSTQKPVWMGNYVVSEFNFTTHFGGPMTARIFSGTLDTSHILVRDCDGAPCLLGRLSVRKLSASGHSVHVRGDLLRPARVWERVLGGQRLVRREEVERAIRIGYSNFKNDLNLVHYVNIVMSYAKGV